MVTDSRCGTGVSTQSTQILHHPAACAPQERMRRACCRSRPSHNLARIIDTSSDTRVAPKRAEVLHASALSPKEWAQLTEEGNIVAHDLSTGIDALRVAAATETSQVLDPCVSRPNKRVIGRLCRRIAGKQERRNNSQAGKNGALHGCTPHENRAGKFDLRSDEGAWIWRRQHSPSRPFVNGTP